LYKIKTRWFRIESAHSRKEMIEAENRKKKIFLLHRWDFIKERRRQYQEDMNLQRQKEYQKSIWIKHLFAK
jgi:hypothetical protein